MKNVILVWLLAVLTFACKLHADIVVTVGDLSLPAGSSGVLPVYISSTASDQLATTSFEFVITQGLLTNTFLAFDPANDTSTATFNATNPPYAPYVFAGNSFDESTPTSLVFNIGTTAYLNDTLNGGDFTADFMNAPGLPGGTMDTLLALLPLTTATGATPAAGDTFLVSLVPLSDDGDTLGLNSGFQDALGNSYAFSSTPGTVTITASSVPEPAAWILGLIAMAFLNAYRAKLR